MVKKVKMSEVEEGVFGKWFDQSWRNVYESETLTDVALMAGGYYVLCRDSIPHGNGTRHDVYYVLEWDGRNTQRVVIEDEDAWENREKAEEAFDRFLGEDFCEATKVIEHRY